jgi:SAM-dependent methyltransferase
MCGSGDCEGGWSNVFPNLPYLAFQSGSLTIRETVYGIVKRLRFLISHVEAERRRLALEPEELRVLDIGCGTGVNVTIPLAGMGYSMVGIDSDDGSINRARNLSAGLTNVEFICGKLEDQVFSQPFHVVICSEVLEHIENPERFLGQVCDNLRSQGLFLLTLPNGFGYFEMESVLWRFIIANPRMERALYSIEYIFWRKFGSKDLLARRSAEFEPSRYSLTQSTLSPGGGTHSQFFRLGNVSRLLVDQGFTILERRNNTIFAGNLLGLLVREIDAFLEWNARAADKLPGFMASGWLIAARADRRNINY